MNTTPWKYCIALVLAIAAGQAGAMRTKALANMSASSADIDKQKFGLFTEQVLCSLEGSDGLASIAGAPTEAMQKAWAPILSALQPDAEPEVLGKGEFGTVYTHPTKPAYIVKEMQCFLPESKTPQPCLQSNEFLAEAEVGSVVDVMAQLVPHFVGVRNFVVGTTPNVAYMVQERRLPLEKLSTLSADSISAGLPEAAVADGFMFQLLASYKAMLAGAMGTNAWLLVHGDLKFDNMMVQPLVPSVQFLNYVAEEKTYWLPAAGWLLQLVDWGEAHAYSVNDDWEEKQFGAKGPDGQFKTDAGWRDGWRNGYSDLNALCTLRDLITPVKYVTDQAAWPYFCPFVKDMFTNQSDNVLDFLKTDFATKHFDQYSKKPDTARVDNTMVIDLRKSTINRGFAEACGKESE